MTVDLMGDCEGDIHVPGIDNDYGDPDFNSSGVDYPSRLNRGCTDGRDILRWNGFEHDLILLSQELGVRVERNIDNDVESDVESDEGAVADREIVESRADAVSISQGELDMRITRNELLSLVDGIRDLLPHKNVECGRADAMIDFKQWISLQRSPFSYERLLALPRDILEYFFHDKGRYQALLKPNPSYLNDAFLDLLIKSPERARKYFLGENPSPERLKEDLEWFSKEGKSFENDLDYLYLLLRSRNFRVKYAESLERLGMLSGSFPLSRFVTLSEKSGFPVLLDVLFSLPQEALIFEEILDYFDSFLAADVPMDDWADLLEYISVDPRFAADVERAYRILLNRRALDPALAPARAYNDTWRNVATDLGVIIAPESDSVAVGVDAFISKRDLSTRIHTPTNSSMSGVDSRGVVVDANSYWAYEKDNSSQVGMKLVEPK